VGAQRVRADVREYVHDRSRRQLDDQYDATTWGNDSFRHFSSSLDDWAASVGLNYQLTNKIALYAGGGRAYKMPALDEFLNAQSPEQVSLFDSRQVQNAELGVKYATPQFGFTVNGFYTLLKNIVGQGAVTDTATGRTTWVVLTSPENESYGAELELAIMPLTGLRVNGNATWLKAEQGSGAGADVGAGSTVSRRWSRTSPRPTRSRTSTSGRLALGGAALLGRESR
jgi:outer membrane receptor protein involved in Fe transport